MKWWTHRISSRVGQVLPMHSVRGYLFTLVVSVALPLGVFAFMEALQDAREQRRNVETGLLNTARALAVAVEWKVQESITVLSLLATSTALRGGDMRTFYVEAERAHALQPAWYTVWLVDGGGHQVFNLLSLYGSELPPIEDPGYARQALATNAPVVSGLVREQLTREPVVAIAVPVALPDGRRMALVAGVRLTSFAKLMDTAGETPAQGILSIVDREHRVIARSHDGDQWMGQPASAQYVQAMGQAAEGVGRVASLEWEDSYVAFRRLNLGGWTLGVGTPADAIDTPLARDIAMTAAVGLGMLTMALIAASVLCGCLTLPLAQLSAGARDIADDRSPHIQLDTPLNEFIDLWQALRRAGEALDERRRLAWREQQLARDLAAAEDRERCQIARDLHDELSQILAALQIRLAVLCRQSDPEMAHCARQVAELALQADRFTRSLSAQIAPPMLHELGLQPALAWLAEEMQRQYELHVQLHVEKLAPPLPAEVRSILYRATRELLINVAKHAHSPAAEVDLRCEDGQLCVCVRDRGMGLAAGDGRSRHTNAVRDPSHRGTGLSSVRERLAHIGGSFTIHDAPGGGTLARLHVPLATRAAQPAMP